MRILQPSAVLALGVHMRNIGVRIAVGVMVFGLCVAATAAAQTLEKVTYFEDSIAEKGDRNHIVRLTGGSNWVLSEPTLAELQTDVIVVMRNVTVESRIVPAAWVWVGGQEIPAKHIEGVYPANSAYLTRVVAAEERGTKLRLADGTELLLPGYNNYISSRWIPPYKALLGSNREFLYNLREGRRVGVQAGKK